MKKQSKSRSRDEILLSKFLTLLNDEKLNEKYKEVTLFFSGPSRGIKGKLTDRFDYLKDYPGQKDF